ncbi:phage terminase large subunit family protein [Escherichia coli]
MNISNSQIDILRRDVRAGLRALFRPEPQTAVEWADASYYLPKESAYQEGRWETLPFQRAIMNAMGSDYIREVNVVKSARVGYSKMLLGVYAYFIEHKQRNTLIWLPTDGDAENFMKNHVEPTIRDIPSLLALAPWYGKKHRDNTLTMKRFSNGRGFWCLGGKAAKNYREKSVDVAGYDELAAFDEDIEQEGSPTFLGDKRIEGSVWPKSIRGSTPKVRGTCQIERAASESPHFMRFHVACPHCGEEQYLKFGDKETPFGLKWTPDDPSSVFYLCEHNACPASESPHFMRFHVACPHCGEEQYLKFGDKETPFGLKWTPDDPSSVFYLCEHNACVIRQQELDFTDARYICEKTGIWTRDGILWFSSSGEEIEPPDSVTFHIWTAYSPFTTWVQIVKDWMKTKGDTGKRKTFVNTTLGETWEAKIGERPDAEVMAERKEHYSAPVPDRVAYLTAGIDSQLDRYEMRVWGWGPGEESWLIDRQIIMGRHDDEQTLLRVDEAINKTYTRRNGAEMSISRICWDTGGIDPTIVYERSKKHGLFRVIPIKGASVYGKPVASMPRKRNKNGVYLTEIGTDTAKEQIYNRFTLTPEGDEPLPGAVVYERSKKHGLFRVIPIKGASVYGKPVASMPRKRNKNGVYLTEIGTDTAKEQIYNRFTLTPEGDEPLPGAVHFPNNPDIFDLTEAQQLTAEEQVEKWGDGRKKILWDSKKRRNEALDCFVYALAALRISISRWQLDLSALLASLQEEDGAATNKKTLADYARALSGEDE